MIKSDNWADDSTAGYGQYTETAEEYVETSFVGSTFYIFGSKSTEHGSFDLYIDGVKNQSVDTSKSTGDRENHILLFSISLIPGFHSIEIIVKSTKVTIDGIYFKPEGLKRIPFNTLTYSNGWTTDNIRWNGEQSIGNWTLTSGSSVEGSFNGGYLLVSGTIDPLYFSADLTIDSGPVQTRNCYNLKRDVKAVLFALELQQGRHTVRFSYNNGLIGFSGFYVGQYCTYHSFKEFCSVAHDQTLEFLGGETTKTISITTYAKEYSRNKNLTFKCKISNPRHFAILGDTNTTSITILYRAVATQKYTHSMYFDESAAFQPSIQFTTSNHFLNSNHFTFSEIFGKTNQLSVSNYFEMTKEHSFSQFNSISKVFSISEAYESTQKFSTSTRFDSTSDFDVSPDFSISNEFVKTNAFSLSKRFSISSDFVQSHAFSISNILSSSQDYSNSRKFDVTNEFSETEAYASTSFFQESGDFSFSDRFIMSRVFSISNGFSESRLYEETY